MKVTFDYQTVAFELEWMPSGKSYRATFGDKTVEVEIVRAENRTLALLIDGKRLTVTPFRERQTR
jgi:hypothetical protein